MGTPLQGVLDDLGWAVTAGTTFGSDADGGTAGGAPGVPETPGGTALAGTLGVDSSMPLLPADPHGATRQSVHGGAARKEPDAAPLSEYELQRAANIARNNKQLAAKGLIPQQMAAIFTPADASQRGAGASTRGEGKRAAVATPSQRVTKNVYDALVGVLLRRYECTVDDFMARMGTGR